MILQYLIEDLKDINLVGNSNVKINKIEYNSNSIVANDIFVAIHGYKEDGRAYVNDAIAKGAVAIILEDTVENNQIEKKDNITYIFVKNARIVLAEISAKYYDFPAKKLKLLGVTGTKGKTTTAHMIYEILVASKAKVGMIGTINIKYADKVIPSTRTTLESLDMHRVFNDMVNAGVEVVVMEISSHALELHRVHGCNFVISVFTNLSEEHLDFHENMDNYLKAKAKLFEMSDFAVINGDDIYSNHLCKMIKCKIAKFGIDNKVNITAADIRVNSNYTEFKMYINKMLETVRVNIPGRFTVYNALAAIGVCSMLNCQMDAILLGLLNTTVEGRNEIVNINKIFTVIVDYAHNPSSLEAILASTKKYAKGRIILVFGCGGNRDKEKRSVMGEIAGKYANFTCITSDNPRDEKPEAIIAQIEEGMKKTNALYKSITDRKEAIKFAMRVAWKNDIVIVAGKGHENYQELAKGKKIYFDDKEVIKKIASDMPDKNIEQTV